MQLSHFLDTKDYKVARNQDRKLTTVLSAQRGLIQAGVPMFS